METLKKAKLIVVAVVIVVVWYLFIRQHPIAKGNTYPTGSQPGQSGLVPPGSVSPPQTVSGALTNIAAGGAVSLVGTGVSLLTDAAQGMAYNAAPTSGEDTSDDLDYVTG